MRFLVCVDGSEFSHSIVPFVAVLAKDASATVEVLHVLKMHEQTAGEPRAGVAPARPRPEDVPGYAEAVQETESLAKAFTPAASASVLAAPDVALAIEQHARETEAGLIAMATHSRGALGEAAMGSVARAVIRSGVAPVLAVSPTAIGHLNFADVPVGIHVFTADGRSLGEFTAYRGGRFSVRDAKGVETWYDEAVASAISAGHLSLAVPASMLDGVRRDAP